MWNTINIFLKAVDDFVWGVPLMVLIMAGGIMLTVRLGLLQMRKLPLALKWMVKNEEGGDGEITSFGALCTALSATIGTGNIVGVATAVGAGGPGALFWMWVTAIFGMVLSFGEAALGQVFPAYLQEIQQHLQRGIATDYPSRLQAYLLHEDGKERSQPQNTAILNGSF